MKQMKGVVNFGHILECSVWSAKKTCFHPRISHADEHLLGPENILY